MSDKIKFEVTLWDFKDGDVEVLFECDIETTWQIKSVTEGNATIEELNEYLKNPSNFDRKTIEWAYKKALDDYFDKFEQERNKK